MWRTIMAVALGATICSVQPALADRSPDGRDGERRVRRDDDRGNRDRDHQRGRHRFGRHDRKREMSGERSRHHREFRGAGQAFRFDRRERDDRGPQRRFETRHRFSGRHASARRPHFGDAPRAHHRGFSFAHGDRNRSGSRADARRQPSGARFARSHQEHRRFAFRERGEHRGHRMHSPRSHAERGRDHERDRRHDRRDDGNRGRENRTRSRSA